MELQPQREQKEVTGSDSLLGAQEWQECSDFSDLRKQEHDELDGCSGVCSLHVAPVSAASYGIAT